MWQCVDAQGASRYASTAFENARGSVTGKSARLASGDEWIEISQDESNMRVVDESN